MGPFGYSLMMKSYRGVSGGCGFERCGGIYGKEGRGKRWALMRGCREMQHGVVGGLGFGCFAEVEAPSVVSNYKSLEDNW